MGEDIGSFRTAIRLAVLLAAEGELRDRELRNERADILDSLLRVGELGG